MPSKYKSKMWMEEGYDRELRFSLPDRDFFLPCIILTPNVITKMRRRKASSYTMTLFLKRKNIQIKIHRAMLQD